MFCTPGDNLYCINSAERSACWQRQYNLFYSTYWCDHDLNRCWYLIAFLCSSSMCVKKKVHQLVNCDQLIHKRFNDVLVLVVSVSVFSVWTGIMMDLLYVFLHDDLTFKFEFTMFTLNLSLSFSKVCILINFKSFKLCFCLFSHKFASAAYLRALNQHSCFPLLQFLHWYKLFQQLLFVLKSNSFKLCFCLFSHKVCFCSISESLWAGRQTRHIESPL